MVTDTELQLQSILSDYTTSIKHSAEIIFDLRGILEEELSEDSYQAYITAIRERVQWEAKRAIDANGGYGMAVMATGSGKSKIGVDKSAQVSNLKPNARILVVVPTEKLRDEGWRDEFTKWQVRWIWDSNVKSTCYASLHTLMAEEWDLVILDECHNITEHNGVFFKNNIVHSCIALTATYPKDPSKIELLTQNKLKIVYSLTLDQAVKLGLVAPYNVVIVKVKIEGRLKTVKAGNLKKSWLQTEVDAYTYLCDSYAETPTKNLALKRMRFIYNLKSKTDACKWILEKIIPQEKRTLIFCGSKNQANEVCQHRYYSKPSTPKKIPENRRIPSVMAKYDKDLSEYNRMIGEYQGNTSFELFADEKIPQLACVDALNEGHNISNLDIGLINQLNSSDLRLTQRIGRIVRFRVGHTATIIILVADGTVDMDWVNWATKNLDKSKFRYIDFEDLKAGKETISFDQ